MNKIINWTVGSFFRTLGRILVYIILGILLSYLLKDIKLPKIDLFQVLDVSADTVKANDMVDIGGNSFGNFYASGIGGNSSTNLQIFISHNIRNFPDITEYTTLVLDVCTGAINQYFSVERTARVGQSCTNSCYSNNIVVNNLGNNAIGSNGYSCQFQRVYIPINKFQISSSCGANVCNVTVDDRISFKNSLSYYVGMDITDVYISDEITYNNDGSMTQQSINNLNTSINNLNSSINNQSQQQHQDSVNQQNAINNQTQQQHQDHQDTINKITDDTPPDNLNALSNSAGWLPAGPVDSILNLPLNFLNSLFNNLSKTCTPAKLPLPYVNKELELPCVNSLYAQINGLPTWINTTVGLIASAFILFSYLLKLYKYIDDTLTFRENNFIDNWSGV